MSSVLKGYLVAIISWHAQPTAECIDENGLLEPQQEEKQERLHRRAAGGWGQLRWNCLLQSSDRAPRRGMGPVAILENQVCVGWRLPVPLFQMALID